MSQDPLFELSLATVDYLVKIIESVLRLELATPFMYDFESHRENRVSAVYSSLAIEGISLSIDDVKAVIEGKVVAGKQKEILEIKNLAEAYELIMTFDPYSVEDFLKAHSILTNGLIKESGKFRGSNGDADDEKSALVGARSLFIPGLIADLFDWAKNSDLHPVIKSAVLHYEIESIYPFEDGNWRVGRLWQTLVLAKWNPLFEFIPMEPVLLRKRKQYYEAIQTSRKADDAAPFVDFKLAAIYESIMDQQKVQEDKRMLRETARKDERKVNTKYQHQGGSRFTKMFDFERVSAGEAMNEGWHGDWHIDELQDGLTDTQIRFLRAFGNKPLSRKEIYSAIRISIDSRSWKRHGQPLLEAGYIKMTVPDRPNSRFQKYTITYEGKKRLLTSGM
ncbi:MAG: Fic family protein [Lachnospiraceae bacterium]|jgi:Fic family protein|nr:Fic family protein [Lachnospiraceae bacterium]